MRPRVKSALLWSAVGALAFLAGVQALQLLTSATVTLDVALTVALAVGVAAGGTAYALEQRVGPAFRRVETDGRERGERDDPGGKEQS